MRVLDLRPRTVKFMSTLWGGGQTVRGEIAEPPSHPPLSRLAARLADKFMARRVSHRRPQGQGPLIVSVGNLALGGTGKTPVVAALATALAADGIKGAVLTRGFGSPLAGPLAVRSDNVLAGDEARLLSLALEGEGWSVIQARRRPAGLDHLLQLTPDVEIVIVEDGHQTAGLGRDLDILILDSWTTVTAGGASRISPVTGSVIPFGPWRESAAGAVRAGIWLLETDHRGPDQGVGGQAVVRFQRQLTLRDPVAHVRVDQPAGRAALVSGIARPESFEASLVHLLPEDPVLSVRCADHAAYGPRVTARILRAAREEGADFLVTTAKDWVKLGPFLPPEWKVLVADLAIGWGRDKALPALVRERLEKFRRR